MNDNQDYVSNPKIELGHKFEDERGVIESVLSFKDPQLGSVVIIDSEKDTIRANHYHKEDWHFCYVLYGSIDYYARNVDSEEKPVKTKINKGELFYSPPKIEHAMYFTEKTSFLTLSGGSRTSEDYEKDLVRVKLI